MGWTVLGALFLAIERLRRNWHVARWFKVALALLTIAAFVKALMQFVTPYVDASAR